MKLGMLVEGRWADADPIQETGKDGDFRRVQSVYREFITADGSSGFRPSAGGIISTSPMAVRGRTAR